MLAGPPFLARTFLARLRFMAYAVFHLPLYSCVFGWRLQLRSGYSGRTFCLRPSGAYATLGGDAEYAAQAA